MSDAPGTRGLRQHGCARDDLLLRLMGTPDPRQIHGLGGATSLTSRIAVVGPSEHPDAAVDYLVLQLGVDELTVSDQQHCGNILAWVGRSPSRGGRCLRESRRRRCESAWSNPDSVAVATFPTLQGRVEYRGQVAIAGVPRTAPVVLAFSDLEGSVTGSLLPTGNLGTSVDGIEVTCVDNGMPVVVATAESFGLTGTARPDRRLSPRGRPAHGLGRRVRLDARSMLLAPPQDGGQVCTRSFIPVQPHSSVAVLAALSVVTGMLLPGVGHDLTASWQADRSPVDAEHPTGHLPVDVVDAVDAVAPRVVRSGAVRKLFDGTALPRA